jgi:hypothetical protein
LYAPVNKVKAAKPASENHIRQPGEYPWLMKIMLYRLYTNYERECSLFI